MSPYYAVCTYVKWCQSCSWGRPECFQTAPISSLSPKLSSDGTYMGVPHQDPTLPIVFGTTWVTPNPKKSCSKSKDDKISSIAAPTAGPAASIRPPGPHPPWMRTGWYCGHHGGPRELQSCQAWVPGLESEIHPPR